MTARSATAPRPSRPSAKLTATFGGQRRPWPVTGAYLCSAHTSTTAASDCTGQSTGTGSRRFARSFGLWSVADGYGALRCSSTAPARTASACMASPYAASLAAVNGSLTTVLEFDAAELLTEPTLAGPAPRSPGPRRCAAPPWAHRPRLTQAAAASRRCVGGPAARRWAGASPSVRHRLDRGRDRQATTRSTRSRSAAPSTTPNRVPSSTVHRRGKTEREALRALKRHVSRDPFKRLADVPLTS
jgi:hypothetical protein